MRSSGREQWESHQKRTPLVGHRATHQEVCEPVIRYVWCDMVTKEERIVSI